MTTDATAITKPRMLNSTSWVSLMGTQIAGTSIQPPPANFDESGVKMQESQPLEPKWHKRLIIPPSQPGHTLMLHTHECSFTQISQKQIIFQLYGSALKTTGTLTDATADATPVPFLKGVVEFQSSGPCFRLDDVHQSRQVRRPTPTTQLVKQNDV